MRVFMTGASGWVGSAVAKDLIEAGHQVVGLVRSEVKAAILRATGVEPLVGSLTDVDVLKKGAETADGVIHTAYGHDRTKMAEAAQEDAAAIETFGSVFAGTKRPIVVTGALGLLPPGQTFTEETPPGPFNPAFPRVSEQTAAALAERGIRATTVRLPRVVHGAGETHGFIPQLIALARQKSVSAYVGAGENLLPAVHLFDAARVFRLALENGSEGGPFHAVAEDGVPFREIAGAIGRHLGIPAISISSDDATAHFGFAARPVSGGGAASNALTKSRLEWEPRELGLIADIDLHYFSTTDASRI
jgi:nucleoside-diphosphate-sugar epimerase